MTIGVFTIIGIFIGFYLAKYQEVHGVGHKIGQKIKQKIEQKAKRTYGEPFVVSTDEARLEQNQVKEEKEIIDLADFPKHG